MWRMMIAHWIFGIPSFKQKRIKTISLCDSFLHRWANPAKGFVRNPFKQAIGMDGRTLFSVDDDLPLSDLFCPSVVEEKPVGNPIPKSMPCTSGQ